MIVMLPPEHKGIWNGIMYLSKVESGLESTYGVKTYSPKIINNKSCSSAELAIQGRTV